MEDKRTGKEELQIGDLRDRLPAGRLWIWGIVALVLQEAGLFGSRASAQWLALALAGMGAVALLQQSILGLAVVVAAALFARGDWHRRGHC